MEVKIIKLKIDTMEFNEKVKELMRNAGMTQKDLSKQSGVSEASLSRYLSGSLKPRMDIVINIAKVFGLDPQKLIDRNNNSKEQDLYKETVNVVARNRNQLSEKEKNEIIKILLGGN